MSNTCGNCDCSDSTHCVKGNQYRFTITESENYAETMAMEGCGCGNGCNCGAGCGCSDCSCCK